MFRVLFIAEHNPENEQAVERQDRIRQVLFEHHADVLELPADVNDADGYVVDLSQTSEYLWGVVGAAVDTRKSLFALGRLSQGPVEVHDASKIRPDGLQTVDDDVAMSGLKTFLGAYMGLPKPHDNDVAWMQVDSPKTRAKLRLTKREAAIVKDMENRDEY